MTLSETQAPSGSGPFITPVWAIITASFQHYKPEDLTLNDIQTFEFLGNNLDSLMDQAVTLIREEKFIPLPELTPSAVFRLNEISLRNIEILDYLLATGRIQIKDFNDPMMSSVIGQLPKPEAVAHMNALISRGFRASEDVLKSQLRNSCSTDVLNSIEQFIPRPKLKRYAFSVLTRMFSPCGNFDVNITNNLMNHFNVAECQVHVLLLNSSSNSGRLPYQTRCFEQEAVLDCWSWILNRFGGFHELSEYCFDDFLLWMSEDSSEGRYERFGPQYAENLFKDFIQSNSDLLQPRHLEKLTIMATIRFWNEMVIQVIKELQDTFQTKLAADVDSLWLWSISFRQSISSLQSRLNGLPPKSNVTLQALMSVYHKAFYQCEAQLKSASSHSLYGMGISRATTLEAPPSRPPLRLIRFSTMEERVVTKSKTLSNFSLRKRKSDDGKKPKVEGEAKKGPIDSVLRFFRRLSLSQ